MADEKYLLAQTGANTDHALKLALEFEGRMDDIPEVAAETAADWLDEHLTNPSNPPIDTSLSVSGAAADAKVTGDKIAALTTETSINLLDNFAATVKSDQTSKIELEYTRTGFRAYTKTGQTLTYGNVWLYFALKPNTTYTLVGKKHKNGEDDQSRGSALAFRKIDGEWSTSGFTLFGSGDPDDTTLAGSVTTNDSGEILVRFYVTWDVAGAGDVTWSDLMFLEGNYTTVGADIPLYTRHVYAQDDIARNQLERGMTVRTELADGTDLNDVIQPGVYLKRSMISVLNGVGDATKVARVVVVGGGTNALNAQFWFDYLGDALWMRTKYLSVREWGDWVKISTEYGSYPGEPFARVADVYAALDAIEAESGGRITHTEISDVLDNDNLPEGESSSINKMRLYTIDTTPDYMKTGVGSGYTVADGPFYPKPKAFIISAQHGDERSNPKIVADLFEKFLWDEEFAPIAAAYEWHIIPVVNVYGYNHNTRRNAASLDINRDYDDVNGFVTTEAQTVKSVYVANEYSLFLDLHNYAEGNKPYDGATAPYPQIGFISLTNLHQDRNAEYERLWRVCDGVGRKAEAWAKNAPGAKKTNAQLCYLWGNYDAPTYNNAASAAGYIRGNTDFNKETATQHPVFCSATVETGRYCKIISGSSTAFNRIAMSFSNVYVENMIKDLANAVLEMGG